MLCRTWACAIADVRSFVRDADDGVRLARALKWFTALHDILFFRSVADAADRMHSNDISALGPTATWELSFTGGSMTVPTTSAAGWRANALEALARRQR